MEEVSTKETEKEESSGENISNSPIVKKLNAKKLRKIRKQMEFYFSDANLEKDKMLGQMVNSDPNGYVELSVFLTFNKIREKTVQLQDIVDALSRSNFLQTNRNFTKVRRMHHFVPSNKDAKDETVYVERLPPHADRRFIRNVFQRFGKVVYINLPYHRKSGKHKGFAFIEFECNEFAQKACEAFKQYSDDESDDEYRVKQESSVKKAKCEDEKNNKASSLKQSRKRRISENKEKPVCKVSKSSALFIPQKNDGHSKHHAQERVGYVKKRKRQTSEGEPCAKIRKESKASDRKKTMSEPISFSIDAKVDEKSVIRQSRETICDNIKSTDLIESESKVKETKTSVSITAVSTEKYIKTEMDCKESEDVFAESEMTAEEPTEVLKSEIESTKPDKSVEETSIEDHRKLVTNGKDLTDGSEMSADESKSTEVTGNGKTLNVSKEEVSKEAAEVASAKKKRKRGAHTDDKLKLRVLSMAEWNNYRNKYLAMQRKAMSAIKKMLLLDRQQRSECDALVHHSSTSNDHKFSEQLVGENKDEDQKYQKGLILKIEIAEGKTMPSLEDLKKQMKSSVDNVAFIDMSVVAESKFYVRFHNAEATSEATSNEFVNSFGFPEVITGEEESLYWKKVEEDRFIQRNRQRPKKRGREKVIARAAKLAERRKHIFFEK